MRVGTLGMGSKDYNKKMKVSGLPRGRKPAQKPAGRKGPVAILSPAGVWATKKGFMN